MQQLSMSVAADLTGKFFCVTTNIAHSGQRHFLFIKSQKHFKISFHPSFCVVVSLCVRVKASLTQIPWELRG